MKLGLIVSTVVALCLAVVVVMGMGRISQLEGEIAELQKEAPAKSGMSPEQVVVPNRAPEPGSRPSKSGRQMVQTDANGQDEEAEAEERRPEEMLGELIRAFSQSDAGKRMERAGQVARARRVFAPLVSEFNFSEEEEGHFLDLAGSAVGADQSLWRDLMLAKEGDREGIMQEFESADAKRADEMKSFLNSEEDWQRYRDYEARLPEYEQIGGIRSAMERAGEPLTDQQEAQLVEVMYNTRVESGMSQRWEGRGVMTQLEQPGIVDRLEQDWESAQTSMSGNLSQVLSPQQAEVFGAQQARTLEQATGGLRFMESALTPGSETPE